jgi:hypothetical protein
VAEVWGELGQRYLSQFTSFGKFLYTKGLKCYAYMKNYFSNENMEQISLRRPT